MLFINGQFFSLTSGCCANDCNSVSLWLKTHISKSPFISWRSSDTFKGMFPTALKGAGLTAFPFNPALIRPVGSINLLRHKSFYRLTEQLSYALLYCYCTHSCCCRSTRLNIFLQAQMMFCINCIAAYSDVEETVWFTCTLILSYAECDN